MPETTWLLTGDEQLAEEGGVAVQPLHHLLRHGLGVAALQAAQTV